MIDIDREQLVSFSEAAKHLPGTPHASTFWRWYAKGIGGIRLETVKIGGRRFTSLEALQRFAAHTGDDQPHVQVRTPAQRERAIKKAEAELERAGW